ncbi:MAG: Xaa-Pro peptidase family protein [bacterium]|nr:Xaa-Pro peptidase family protein [bacterium]
MTIARACRPPARDYAGGWQAAGGLLSTLLDLPRLMNLPVSFDFRARRLAFERILDEAGVDLVWLPLGADLEYLTGIQRRVPTFGEVNYTHGWIAGAFVIKGRDPIFLLPRNFVEFDLPEGVPGEVVKVDEMDDGPALFARAASSLPRPRALAVGARTWATATMRLLEELGSPSLVDATRLLNRLRRIKSAGELAMMRRACRIADEAMEETKARVSAGVTELELAEEVNFHLLRLGSRTWSFDTAVWSMGPGDDRDANVRLSQQQVRGGMGLSFDFGAVVQGYCSDFGRTIRIGEPDGEYRHVYELVMAAQQAGIDAVRPGVKASEVHRATRQVIVDAGYGDWFRHRTGHCIGLDVHEEPFISPEDDTPLEAGMTFTIEPSVFWPGRVGVRVEDIILCTPQGGVKLNEHPTSLAVRE